MWHTIAIYIRKLGDMLMRTMQMALDDDLVDAVHKIVKKPKVNRSSFTRQALRNALTQANGK
jgi:metal-responsive CopG/Arc/MetJ family transcriptional regulator